MVCEHLCLDLFDPAWEIRHGAGIGLRSILKAHGEGAGKRGKGYKCAVIIRDLTIISRR